MTTPKTSEYQISAVNMTVLQFLSSLKANGKKQIKGNEILWKVLEFPNRFSSVQLRYRADKKSRVGLVKFEVSTSKLLLLIIVFFIKYCCQQGRKYNFFFVLGSNEYSASLNHDLTFSGFVTGAVKI